jgi:hypothetical protein
MLDQHGKFHPFGSAMNYRDGMDGPCDGIDVPG